MYRKLLCSAIATVLLFGHSTAFSTRPFISTKTIGTSSLALFFSSIWGPSELCGKTSGLKWPIARNLSVSSGSAHGNWIVLSPFNLTASDRAIHLYVRHGVPSARIVRGTSSIEQAHTKQLMSKRTSDANAQTDPQTIETIFKLCEESPGHDSWAGKLLDKIDLSTSKLSMNVLPHRALIRETFRCMLLHSQGAIESSLEKLQVGIATTEKETKFHNMIDSILERANLSNLEVLLNNLEEKYPLALSCHCKVYIRDMYKRIQTQHMTIIANCVGSTLSPDALTSVQALKQVVGHINNAISKTSSEEYLKDLEQTKEVLYTTIGAAYLLQRTQKHLSHANVTEADDSEISKHLYEAQGLHIRNITEQNVNAVTLDKDTLIGHQQRSYFSGRVLIPQPAIIDTSSSMEFHPKDLLPSRFRPVNISNEPLYKIFAQDISDNVMNSLKQLSPVVMTHLVNVANKIQTSNGLATLPGSPSPIPKHPLNIITTWLSQEISNLYQTSLVTFDPLLQLKDVVALNVSPSFNIHCTSVSNQSIDVNVSFFHPLSLHAISSMKCSIPCNHSLQHSPLTVVWEKISLNDAKMKAINENINLGTQESNRRLNYLHRVFDSIANDIESNKQTHSVADILNGHLNSATGTHNNTNCASKISLAMVLKNVLGLLPLDNLVSLEEIPYTGQTFKVIESVLGVIGYLNAAGIDSNSLFILLETDDMSQKETIQRFFVALKNAFDALLTTNTRVYNNAHPSGLCIDFNMQRAELTKSILEEAKQTSYYHNTRQIFPRLTNQSGLNLIPTQTTPISYTVNVFAENPSAKSIFTNELSNDIVLRHHGYLTKSLQDPLSAIFGDNISRPQQMLVSSLLEISLVAPQPIQPLLDFVLNKLLLANANIRLAEATNP
ncbi:hypothetical protein NEHOM01_1388 [Nematocida homosporus]|uniref:uncharacterized protein n=1 Tax=Nematocida homosporus TaxID=1912981 RepID=UPI00221E79C3|nr:uncharacterized protein NEHOM01_1388 [Nematocida homosporus]KAI5186324.1 hypothetical protein NEHOM01_1388 [Nematocida homosporus]